MTQQQPFELRMPVNPGDHAIGPPLARVTVVEYGDFECPNCKQAAPGVKLLLGRFAAGYASSIVTFRWKRSIRTRCSPRKAAESAGAQGKFWPMHDLLFDNQAHLKANALRGYAERLQLDLARYTSDMKDHGYLQRITGAHPKRP